MNRHERLAEKADQGQSVRAHVPGEGATVSMNGPSYAAGRGNGETAGADLCSHGAQPEVGQAGIS